jgi:hypothetical protein
VKKLEWLLKLADSKPLLFSLALLLIAISTLSLVIKNREGKLQDCQQEQRELGIKFQLKLDSINNYYRDREVTLQQEVKATLNTVIEDYRRQLDEQKNLNQQVQHTLKINENLLHKTSVKIKTLEQ